MSCFGLEICNALISQNKYSSKLVAILYMTFMEFKTERFKVLFFFFFFFFTNSRVTLILTLIESLYKLPFIVDSNDYRKVQALYTFFRKSMNILPTAVNKMMMIQAEAKSSTSSQLMLLMTLTTPRKILANVCIASMHKSLRKEII